MNGAGTFRLGISEFTTTPWTFEEDVEHYAAHGLDAIEVCEFKLEKSALRPQMERVVRANLTVSSVQMRVHALFPDSLAPHPEDPSERLLEMQKSIDAFAPLLPANTPFVVITGAAPRGNCEYVYEHACDALPRLADFAAARGMRIAFEPLNPILFHTDTSIWRLDDALALIERVDHPALGICCDTWNIFQTPDVTSVIRQCEKHIFLVQVSDWRRPRANSDRRSLGDGLIPTASLLRAIRDTHYDWPYVVEIFSSTSLPDSLWRADMDVVIDRNIGAFENFWQDSEGIPQ